jgi:putative tryptophan/tyrosine transport system substrate-binding protein
MRRRDFIRLLGGATLAAPLAAQAEEPRTYRVGCLWPFPRGTREASLLADALRPCGFIDGHNLTVDYRPWGQHVDQIWDYAAELVKERVDAISTGGDLGIRAAQKATSSIPILGVTDDRLGPGFVTSLARPTGNITGVSILAPELDGKRQEILIEALPGIQRMAALADSQYDKASTTRLIKVGGTRAEGRTLASLDRERRRHPAGYRCGKGVRRRCIERSGVADAQQQSPRYH